MARNAVPEVRIVRLKVWLTDLSIISAVTYGLLPRSSRSRSKITIVSLIEKPTIVKSAATTSRLILKSSTSAQPRKRLR